MSSCLVMPNGAVCSCLRTQSAPSLMAALSDCGTKTKELIKRIQFEFLIVGFEETTCFQSEAGCDAPGLLSQPWKASLSYIVKLRLAWATLDSLPRTNQAKSCLLSFAFRFLHNRKLTTMRKGQRGMGLKDLNWLMEGMGEGSGSQK